MSQTATLSITNGTAAEIRDVPLHPVESFTEAIIGSIRRGGRLSALFGVSSPAAGVRVYAVLAQDEAGRLEALSADVEDEYPALTPNCPQAHWFEREIAEQWGVIPVGHPWLKPIRFHRSYRPGHDAWARDERTAITPGVTDFFQIHGEEVHEVAVGPVHAGVIEPGHFRFQCHGEEVLHLEISLGYQHRGVERALAGGPAQRSVHFMETLAGDTTIGHTLAYCHVLEALGAAEAPPRAQAIRGVALELERLANHTGDLGALAGDVGYLPTASYCGRLRGDFLNMSALICGSRFGRGLVRPGGSCFDLDDHRVADLRDRLEKTFRDLTDAVELLFGTPSVMARFEETGAVPAEVCRDLGLVGPAARASGLARDVRHDFPSGIFRQCALPLATGQRGDVHARAWVRVQEIRNSVQLLRLLLGALPAGSIRSELPALAPDRMAVVLEEGWRGEICHVALTDSHGRFARYKVVDPSFHNWMGLAMALRGQQISDFPLCNKSFNLSYCGHDL